MYTYFDIQYTIKLSLLRD